MLRIIAALAVSSALIVPIAAAGSPALVPSATAGGIAAPEVANRKGSKRVGGTNSHGKGSHYVGGRKSTARKK